MENVQNNKITVFLDRFYRNASIRKRTTLTRYSNDSCTMSMWSDLLPEILNKIAGKLDFYEDYINFHCVCSSWRSSTTIAKKTIQHLPCRFPLLMLAESEDDEQDFRRFFLLSSGTMHKVQLPEAHCQRCISAHGWLLTTGEEEFSVKLLHPLSRTQIQLPEFYMFEDLYDDQDEWRYYGYCMRRVVFTSSNPLLSDPDFGVVIIWGETIGFCRLGDVSWTRVIGWEGDLLNITYHKMRRRLYVVTSMGSIYECNILNGGSSLCRLSTIPGKEFWCSFMQSAYVLEWDYGSLLILTRKHQSYEINQNEFCRYGPYITKRFQCFVLSLDDGKWSKLVSFGNKAVFLGFNSSFAIDAGVGMKPDCIYFTDDIYEPYRGIPDGGGRDVGVYHMSDGSIDSIFDSQESIFRARPPLWIQPSTMPAVKEF